MLPLSAPWRRAEGVGAHVGLGLRELQVGERAGRQGRVSRHILISARPNRDKPGARPCVCEDKTSIVPLRGAASGMRTIHVSVTLIMAPARGASLRD